MTRREDFIYEYKSNILKDLSKFPDSKCDARQFIANRIRVLKKELEKEKSVRKKYVIKKIINMYEDLK
jgi:hypothetical protein